MGGFNVLVKFPDGTQKVLLAIEFPSMGLEITDGGKSWKVTSSHKREDTINDQEINFEAEVEEIHPPKDPPIEFV